MHSLILFHGLASTPKEFGMLVHPLRRAGVLLRTPTVEGYSHGMLGTSARWRDWVSAATRSVEAELAASPGPFILGGLCSGAMLAGAVAERLRGDGLRGLALLSPLFAYDGWSLPWYYRLRKLAYLLHVERFFSMHERAPFGLKNERMRQWVRNQMQTEQATLVGPAQVALGHVRESERLSRHVVQSLARLDLPILVQHAREDEICSLAAVQASLSGVPRGRLTLRVHDNSYHMITADNDRLQVAEALSRFTQSLMPASPAAAPTCETPWTRSTN